MPQGNSDEKLDQIAVILAAGLRRWRDRIGGIGHVALATANSLQNSAQNDLDVCPEKSVHGHGGSQNLSSREEHS
jgi:hypothetical protein